jgi:adenosylcobinamide kinase/adenosylcobinamide-phosphate guanylyltransferase
MTENDLIEKNGEIILILGGARSGKSRHAQEIGEPFKGRKLFVATAQALDEEMSKRIENHRKQRGARWETREEPVELVRVISEAQMKYDVILIDCLTLWISNLLMAHGEDRSGIENAIQSLIDSLKNAKTTTILVSNEVGLGIVPDNQVARSFRDLAGMLNQRVAQVADRVIFMVAGLPINVKGCI